jgi:hypothetical protein
MPAGFAESRCLPPSRSGCQHNLTLSVSEDFAKAQKPAILHASRGEPRARCLHQDLGDFLRPFLMGEMA